MNTNLELIRENGISNLELQNNLEASLGDLRNLKKVLLVVPDNTRSHSRAGDIAEHYYNLLKDTCDVDVLIALGTHVPMSSEECAKMFGEIPYSKFIHHNWRTDVVNICLLYTSDAADDLLCVDLGGRRIINKKTKKSS